MRSFSSGAEVVAAVGADLGYTSWRQIDQTAVDRFNEATSGSRRPMIHVPDMLVLSAISPLLKELYEVDNVASRLNYGAEIIRFHEPVQVGTALRARGSVHAAEASSAGLRVTFRMEIEAATGRQPVCVADVIVLLVGLTA